MFVLRCSFGQGAGGNREQVRNALGDRVHDAAGGAFQETAHDFVPAELLHAEEELDLPG